MVAIASSGCRSPCARTRSLSHRSDPMSTSLYSTPTASSGAALVGAGDREAPHTHSVTTQREREAMLHHADERSPPPPSLLAASQRPCRPLLSRARRKLNGASHRSGLLRYLQIFIHYLHCIGEEYSANGQRHAVYFHTDDMASTRDWKAIPSAQDSNRPTIFFTGETEGQRLNPVTDSGVGPIPGVEP
jgi:hypothetical protein